MIRVRIVYGDMTSEIETDAGYNPDILEDCARHTQVGFITAMSTVDNGSEATT